MKNQSLILISLLSVLVGVAIGYALWVSNNLSLSHLQMNNRTVPAGMHRMPDGSLMGNSPADHDMHMMQGMDHSNMMVTSERAFLEGMIPHHQEAVDTAKEVIARGGSTPEIKELAENIVVAQEREIALMKEWYQTWYGVPYTEDPEAYEPMMRDLSKLEGAALDKVFLEDMIMHHMGALMMAKSVAQYIEHQEMTDLTRAILETQTAEIGLMRRLVSDL